MDDDARHQPSGDMFHMSSGQGRYAPEQHQYQPSQRTHPSPGLGANHGVDYSRYTPLSHDGLPHKPSLLSQDSGDTIYSETSSTLTSSSSSVGTPGGISPFWNGQPFQSQDRSHKQSYQQAGEPHVSSLSSDRNEIWRQDSSGRRSSIGPPKGMHIQHHQDKHDEQIKNEGHKAGHADASSDHTNPAARRTQQPPIPSTSSSSSSSSSSVLSDFPYRRRPYQTPSTADLEQQESALQRKNGPDDATSGSGHGEGYPFPAVGSASRTADMPEVSTSTRTVRHDPWRHTDDLLAPTPSKEAHNGAAPPGSTVGVHSGLREQTHTGIDGHNGSAPARSEFMGSSTAHSDANTAARSSLSLSKPPLSNHSSVLARSQANTPEMVQSRRRSSQSSSVASATLEPNNTIQDDDAKTRSWQVLASEEGARLSGRSPSSAIGHAKGGSGPGLPLNSSSGTSTVSPLSPLVEPFNPSAHAAQPSSGQTPVLARLTTTSAQAPAARNARSQSVTASQAHTHRSGLAHEQGSQNYVGYSTPHGYDERQAFNAAANSNVDNGYAPAYTSQSAGYVSASHNRLPTPSSASSAQSAFGFHHPSRSASEDAFRTDAAAVAARQRAFSDGSGLSAVAASAYAPANMASVPGWMHAHPSIQEHIEFDFTQTQNQGLDYSDPRGMRHNPYISSGPTSASYQHKVALSAMQNQSMRAVPSARSQESFDVARYGYGPGSISDVSVTGTEEISTIFVVGFPEDIQEREFQNMFLFARGFEAATLKIPASTAAARERDAAAAAAVSAIAATLPAFAAPPPPPALDPNHGHSLGMQSAVGSSYDHLNNALYEETFLAAAANPSASANPGSTTHLESAHRVSSALAAAALTATASNVNLANTTNRKQIIGFAKFRSRDDAMEARDLLSGRKIDPEKGCVLKAEMAKKNLHVKKSGSSEIPIASTGSIPSTEQIVLSSRSSSSALDRLAEREREREWRARAMASNVAVQPQNHANMSHYPLGAEGGDAEALSGYRRDSVRDAAFEAFHSVPTGDAGTLAHHSSDPRYPMQISSRSSPVQSLHAQHGSVGIVASAAAAEGFTRQRALTGTSTFGKDLLKELDEQEDVDFPLPDPSPGFGASAYPIGLGEVSTRRHPPPPALPPATSQIGVGTLGGYSYLDEDYRRLALTQNQSNAASRRPQHDRVLSVAGYSADIEPTGPMASPGSAGTPTSSATAAALSHTGVGSGPFASPELISPTHTEFRQPRTQNRADDNTPISTLYVGGLPSSAPNLAGSVPATQIEDALRVVFSRCAGFRRMSYRQKSQGPMCFVEFEDTSHATKALNEVYGHTLGGLVKGGIRLAYSKNPLGVRSSASSGPGSPTPLSPSYFASDMVGHSGYPTSPPVMHMGLSPVHGQGPAPIAHSRSPHYDTSALGNYQHSSMRVQQTHQAALARQAYSQSSGDSPAERRATSPHAYPGSAFSPFARET